MKAESIRVSAVLPAAPAAVYAAWLSAKEHAAFTGSGARVTAKVGGRFSAWDGYITGRTLALKKTRRIVQSWRTTDFPDDAPDSRLEIILEPSAKGARITLVHTEIPAGQAAGYRQGWKEYYFTPMKEYFADRGDRPRKKPR
jgi:activator of HSP90 ATPase